MRHRLALCVASGVAMCVALPAHAQRNNGSDVSGVAVTGSTVAGAIYIPTITRVPAPIAEGAAISSPTVAQVNAAVANIQQQLTSGALTTIAGTTVTAPQQRLISAVFVSATRSEALATIRAAFQPAAVQAPVLNALVMALSDMGTFPTPRNVALAVDAYNAFVAQAAPEFLASAPGEFVAVHAALRALGTAANEVSGR